LGGLAWFGIQQLRRGESIYANRAQQKQNEKIFLFSHNGQRIKKWKVKLRSYDGLR
jgi:hypothetical protein